MRYLIKKIIIKMLLLLLVAVIPIAMYIFIEDDVQLTWNINAIREMNKYTIVAEFFPEKEKLSVSQNVEYVNDTNKRMDKLFFHFNNIIIPDKALYQEIEESVYEKKPPYKIGEIEYIKIKNKKADFKIVDKNNSILMIILDKELEIDDKVTIEIKYNTIISHLVSNTNEGKKVYNLSNCFPTIVRYNNGWEFETTNDNESDQYINYFIVDIVVPEGFEVKASGRLIEKIKVKGNYNFKFQDQGTLGYNVNIISTK